MRIVFCNWKDLRNPDAGGAEVFTHEVARRLVAAGHQITLFCRSFPGAAREDLLDGVGIVRRGGALTVYRHALHWLRKVGNQYDLIIDEVNTRPFMACKLPHHTPVVMLIHQLAKEVWNYETPFPVNVVGRYILEPLWLHRVRNVPTVTVSRSTANDLRRLGFRLVEIVPEGLRVGSSGSPSKELVPTLLFVGRLISMKRPQDALDAHRLVRQRFPSARLWIVGDGYLRARLERRAGDGVTFFGRVSDEDKKTLMDRAHLLLFPAVREGWGLAITEAGAAGTPAVGYRVPGVVDAIRDRETGFIVDPTPEAMAKAVIRLLDDSAELNLIRHKAIEWARSFDWDSTALAFLEFAQRAVRHATGADR